MFDFSRISKKRRYAVSPAGVIILTGALLFTGSTTLGQTESDDATLRHAERLSAAFQAVADGIQDSVVSIQSARRMTAPQTPFRLSPFQGTPFGDLFGENDSFGTPAPEQEQPREFWQEGQGSGFVISADGYIITNNHVIDSADQITVRFSDDRSYPAEIVGTDPRTDIAVIKVDADGLSPAKLGDSNDLHVGQWVVAAGNPFGLQSTITAGIVSATGRSRVGIADYEDFIQTDAAINPGNSGGPLVNLYGEVVGVNTAIYSGRGGGGNVGIGFAIPINMVKSIKDSLISEGRVVRGFLGAVIQNLNEGLAKSFGFEGTNGVLIAEVSEGGPADEAGLQPGDVVTRFGGERVSKMDELRLRVAETKPGSEIEVVFHRDGEKMTKSVTIGELETPDTPSQEALPGERSLGMEVRTLTPNAAGRMGLDESTRGVLVTRVEPYSAAARATLRAGDLVLKVQNDRVETVDAFRNALRDADLESGVRLTVLSGGSQRFVFLQSAN
ncbi:MAG: Do family serine endopeptidase [Phycisphaerales bacterium]